MITMEVPIGDATAIIRTRTPTFVVNLAPEDVMKKLYMASTVAKVINLMSGGAISVTIFFVLNDTDLANEWFKVFFGQLVLSGYKGEVVKDKGMFFRVHVVPEK